MVVALVLIAILGLLAGLFWFWLVWGASTRAMRPPRRASDGEIAIPSRTGITLSGRFVPGSNGATIVLTHGYGGAQDELLPVAEALREAGFGALMYDLRGCGRSEGDVTFGALEQLDLHSVVDYVASREDGPIGAFGFSVGAATTIMAAARDPRIRAVAADSAWTDAYSWLRPSVQAAFLHPRAPFSAVSLKLVELRARARLRDLRPVDDVGALAPRPLLLLHGLADDVVLPGDTERLYAAAGEPKEQRLVEGAGHTDTIAAGGAAAGLVPAFFERALFAESLV